LGYQENQPEVNNTLFFKETDPVVGKVSSLINICYTTKSIVTYLNHTTTDPNKLWRSNAYENLWNFNDFFRIKDFLLETLIEIKGMLSEDVPYMEYSKIDISIPRTSVNY